MEKPFVIINGKRITPDVPKMGTWRKFLKAQAENTLDKPVEEFVTNAVELIVIAFNHQLVTAESLEENLEITDVLPLVKELSLWFQSLTFDKLVKIPPEEGESVQKDS